MPCVLETLNACNAYVNQSESNAFYNIQDFREGENEYKFRYPKEKLDVLAELDNHESDTYKDLHRCYRQYYNLLPTNTSFKDFIDYIIFGDVRPKFSYFKDQKGIFTLIRAYMIKGAKPKFNEKNETISLEFKENKIWICESAIDMCVTALIKAGNNNPQNEDIRAILSRFTQFDLTNIEINNLFTYGITIIKRKVVEHFLENTYHNELGHVYCDRINNLSEQFKNSFQSYFYNASTDTFIERQFAQIAEKTLDFAGLKDKLFTISLRTQSPILKAIVTIIDRMFTTFDNELLNFTQFKNYIDEIYNNITLFGRQTNSGLVKLCNDLKQTFDTIFSASDKPTLIRIVDSWMHSAVKTTRSIIDTVKVYLGYAVYKMLTTKMSINIYNWFKSYKNDKIEKVTIENAENKYITELIDFANEKYSQLKPKFNELEDDKLKSRFLDTIMAPLMDRKLNSPQRYIVSQVFNSDFKKLSKKLEAADTKWIETYIDNIEKRMYIASDNYVNEDF